jgi:hypothetical protein
MNVPAGFKRWRFHWFECPACGHRDWRAFANVTMAQEPRRLVWRFWCERCGAYSTLAQPAMPTLAAAIVLLFVGPVALAFVWWGLRAGVGFEWLVILFAAFWLAYPLVFLAVTRWAYRYVPPG